MNPGSYGTTGFIAHPTSEHHSRWWDFTVFTNRRRAFLVLFGAPALIYVIVIAIWPLTQGIWYSFFDYSLLRPNRREFIGLENYQTIFSQPEARHALINTFVFTFFAILAEFVLGMTLALALWRDNRFNRVSLAFILIPVSITPVVAGLIFRAILTPDFGIIGYWAVELGLTSKFGLLGDPSTALATVIMIDVWQWTPLLTLILLAGLKSLPEHVLEAASVDGATLFQRFRLVVFPMLLPAVFLGMIFRTMDAFRVFDVIFATTQGGPGDKTNVLMVYAVKQGLQFFNIGFGSAIANLMILCIIGLSLSFILVVRRADKRNNT